MEDVLNFIKENDYFEIFNSADGHFIDWLEKQDRIKFEVVCVDYENELVWTNDCPYAISFNDIIKIESEV